MQPVRPLTAINQSQVSQTDLVHYWYLLSLLFFSCPVPFLFVFFFIYLERRNSKNPQKHWHYLRASFFGSGGSKTVNSVLGQGAHFYLETYPWDTLYIAYWFWWGGGLSNCITVIVRYYSSVISLQILFLHLHS